MKNFDFAQLAGIVANIGVIAGLVFLAIELSQNTDAMRSQTVNALQGEFREIFDYPAGFVEANFKNSAERTAEDEFIRRAFFTRLMRIYENQWYQNQRGYLDDELFYAYQQHLRITLGNEDFNRL
jgi:hypothetical protein